MGHFKRYNEGFRDADCKKQRLFLVRRSFDDSSKFFNNFGVFGSSFKEIV